MKKTYTSVMRCAVCRRPLSRAAALKGGQPVGPACAAAAGLLAGRGGDGAKQQALNFSPSAVKAEPVRCEQTMELFE